MFSKVLAAFAAAGGFLVGAGMLEILADDIVAEVAGVPGVGGILVLAVPSLITAVVAYLKSEHRFYDAASDEDE